MASGNTVHPVDGETARHSTPPDRPARSADGSELGEFEDIADVLGGLEDDMETDKSKRFSSGVVTKRDLQEAKSKMKKMKSMGNAMAKGQMRYTNIQDESMRAVFSKFDVDNNGTVDAAELQIAADLYVKEKQSAKSLKKGLLISVALIIILVIANAATTFLAIELSKESKVGSDGVMRSVATDAPLQVGSVDSSVENGAMVDRETGNPVGVTLHTRALGLTSHLPNEAFKQLKYFEATSDLGAFVYVQVNGFMRMPTTYQNVPGPGGVNPTPSNPVVKMFTPYGTITLEGSVLSFSDSIPQVFTDAGFITSSRRSLLGVKELVGFFAMLEDYVADNPDLDIPIPQLPEKLHTVSTTYQPCGINCMSYDEELGTQVYNPDYIAGTEDRFGERYEVYHEDGWTLRVGDDVMFRAERSYPRYPDFKIIEINNGTHTAMFQRFEGHNYHCSPISSLNKTVEADTSGWEFTYLDSAPYTIQPDDHSEDQEPVALEATVYSIKSPSTGMEATYYAWKGFVDVPIAIVTQGLSGAGGASIPVTTEFSHYNMSAEVDISMFDLEVESAACRTEENYIMPIDMLANGVVGMGFITNGPGTGWGEEITQEEKDATTEAIDKLPEDAPIDPTAGNFTMEEIMLKMGVGFANKALLDSDVTAEEIVEIADELVKEAIANNMTGNITFDGEAEDSPLRRRVGHRRFLPLDFSFNYDLCWFKLILKDRPGPTGKKFVITWMPNYGRVYCNPGNKITLSAKLTDFPAAMPLFAIEGDVVVDFRNNYYAGCIKLNFQCGKFFKSKGIEWVGDVVCPRITFNGGVCAGGGQAVSARCSKNVLSHYGNEYYYGGYFCTNYRWWCFNCCSWARYRYTRRVPVYRKGYDGIYVKSYGGVQGWIQAGIDVWGIAGFHAKIQIKWYQFDLDHGAGDTSRDGGYLGAKAIGRAWWPFGGGLSLALNVIPWNTPNSELDCASTRMEFQGFPFVKL